jgi:hypothetical protein
VGVAQAAFLVDGLWAQAFDLADTSRVPDESTSTGAGVCDAVWSGRATELAVEASALEALLLAELDAATAAVHDLTPSAADAAAPQGNVFLPSADVRLLRQRCVPSFASRATAARAAADQAACLGAALRAALAAHGALSDGLGGSSGGSVVPLAPLLAALLATRAAPRAAGAATSGAPAGTTRGGTTRGGTTVGVPPAGKLGGAAAAFTPEDLALSRKAAKATMSPETFRAWRAAKKSSGDDGDFD